MSDQIPPEIAAKVRETLARQEGQKPGSGQLHPNQVQVTNPEILRQNAVLQQANQMIMEGFRLFSEAIQMIQLTQADLRRLAIEEHQKNVAEQSQSADGNPEQAGQPVRSDDVPEASGEAN